MDREEAATAAREELRQRLRQSGLGRVEDVLMERARYAIRLTLTPTTEDAVPVGASKMGGQPDLPTHVPWPEVSGRPMAFIAQINLQEAAPYDIEGILPSDGLLSFFVDDPDDVYDDEAFEDDPSDAPTCRVLYLDEDDCATLTRQRWPSALLENYLYTSAAIGMRVVGTLPDSKLPSIRTLLTEQERQSYWDVRVGTIRESAGDWHWLLGYASAQGESPELAHFASLQKWGVDWDTLTQALDGFGDQALAERVEREGADWRLLLQVYGNSEANMGWYGGGVLHFVLPGRALAAHDFSFVSAAVQSL